MSLEVSKYGRPIVWLVRWSAYGGKVCGYGMYSSKTEAMRDAISHAGLTDWENFPAPNSEDRDGFEPFHLTTPTFRRSWTSEGGGYSEVCECEVADNFTPFSPSRVDEIYSKISNRDRGRRIAATVT